MSRRRAKSSDSLDLLLDTICNTFGGILFIALLVVILLEMHREESVASSSSMVTADELAMLQAEFDAAQADAARLRNLHQIQQQTLDALAPPELAPLVEGNAAATRQNTELWRRRDEMLSEMASLATSIEQMNADIRNAADALKAAQARVSELQQQLDTDRKARQRELRTPVQRRPSGTAEIGLVLQYGRLYVWHQYDGFGTRLGLNTDEFLVIEDTLSGAYTTPRPTAGVTVDGSAESRQQLLGRLRRFSPRSAHIAVIVRPDSFGEWATVRDILTQRGFDYRLMPTDVDTLIVDRGGEGRVQ